MEIKQYKNHKHVEDKYKWDLEDILQGKSIHYWINEYEKLTKARIKVKDSKYDSIEAYLEDLKLNDEQTLVSNKIYNYISNNLNTDLTNPAYIKLDKEFEFKSHELSQELGSELPRFFANLEKIKLWKDDPRLKSYKRGIEDLIDSQKYKLDDKVEEYLVQSALGEPNPHTVFGILSDSELDYGYVTLPNGSKTKLDPIKRTKLLKSNIKEVRKQAYQNYWNAYFKHKDSFAELLYQHFNKLVSEAKIRKYDSAVSMLTYDDQVSDEILQKLFSKVSEKRYILKKYLKNLKSFYKKRFKEEFHDWDSTRDLVKVKTEYSVAEANDLVLKALKPFGQEYYDQVYKALNENWVDYMSTTTKRSGAYSIGGTYGIEKKYILMNFDGTLGSVETLAHELGHSMHSYYSDKHNDINNASYPIFLAEIASIFNELMLFDYLTEHSDNERLKFYILNNLINGFNGTVHKQVLWANYEYDLYNAIQKGQANSSYDSISKIYYQNSLKYMLVDTYKYSQKQTIQSIYVPHYYYGFYVYKYAIGQLVAIYFFKQYKKYGKQALDNYISNFLSAGGNDYPLEILKKVGVDLTNDQFYDEGYSYLEELVTRWTKIGQKLFK